MATIKIGNKLEGFSPKLGNTTYLLEEGKEVHSPDTAISSDNSVQNVVFQLDGLVKGGDIGLQWANVGVSSAPVRIVIGDEGRVEGETTGIVVHASGSRIDNAGRIQGHDGLSFFGGHDRITNSGDIVAIDGGIEAIDGASIRNSGEISSSNHAIKLDGDIGSTVINTGVLSGSTAIEGSDGNDRIVNSGTLGGWVELNGGDDMFIFKGGRMDGLIFGGDGNDTFVIRKSGLELLEHKDQGYDTVRTSISTTLGDNFEKLVLTGKKDLDGAGTDDDNQLYGNAGRNELTGGDGFDTLAGGRGNDVLTGGLDGDTFQFALNSGRDAITDFEIGADEIDFGGLKGAKGFDNMLAKHVEQKGDDVWITYGDDTVVLKNTASGDLQSGDFIF